MNSSNGESRATVTERARAEGRTPEQDIVPGVPDDLTHSVDQDGSLITVPPADWMICFVPGLKKQWWHRFVPSSHKHVFAIRPLDDGRWLLAEPWWTRLMVTVLPSPDAVKFMRWGATGDILKVREAVPGRGNQLRGWSNCAVLMAFVLGRSSWSWTPDGLYRQLVKEPGVEPVDVQELLVQQFTTVVGRYAAEALRLEAGDLASPLESVLTKLGRNMLSAFLSPHLLQLCHTAIIEAERFPRATLVYHEHGLKPGIEAITRVLEHAQTKGEVKISNCRRAASQFIAMLRGNVHLEAVIELRDSPTVAEIEARAEAAVKVFLRGVRPRAA